MNKEDVIWMAGIVDGEGSITVSKGVDKRYNNNPWWSLDILIVNTIVANLTPFEEYFGGEVKEKQIDGNRKRSYYWRPPTEQRLKLLEAVYPYVRGKKLHVELAIDFLKRNKAKGGMDRLTLEQVSLRERIYHQFKILNKRGK